jgi:hypothetical protein
MEELKPRHTGEGAEIDVELGEREGLIAGLYPVRPLRSALTADAGRPGRLAFTATLLDATGAPARGDHVVEIEVTDPAGERRSNYSGLRCTANGVFKFDEPFAVNARRGTWTVALFDRFTRQKHSVAVAR